MLRSLVCPHVRRLIGHFASLGRFIAQHEQRAAADSAALAELSRAYPQIDRDEWTRRVEAARAQHSRPGGAAAAARELFRALRALFATMPR